MHLNGHTVNCHTVNAHWVNVKINKHIFSQRNGFRCGYKKRITDVQNIANISRSHTSELSRANGSTEAPFLL